MEAGVLLALNTLEPEVQRGMRETQAQRGMFYFRYKECRHAMLLFSADMRGARVFFV